MNCAELLTEGFNRIAESVGAAVEGLSAQQLEFRADADANSIAWLVWHLTRVQDDHVSGVADVEQAWTAQGWADRFDLPFDRSEIGYGQSSSDVAAVRVRSADLLSGYHDAVHQRTQRYVAGLSEADLDCLVDEAWDPPVTLGVRLISVLNDDLQHVGQAAFVRGLVLRR